jgi:hypothetical protein
MSDAADCFSLKRMWINQPSTHQQHHGLHGVNVLCNDLGQQFVYVWFTSGPVVSMKINRLALSAGWR